MKKNILLELLVLFSAGSIFAECRIETHYFKTQDGGCKHLDSGIVWSQKSQKAMSLAAASRYCADLKEGGFSDWKLPFVDALKIISGDSELYAAFHFKFSVNEDFWSVDKAVRTIDYTYTHNTLWRRNDATFVYAHNLELDNTKEWTLSEHIYGVYYGQPFDKTLANESTLQKKLFVLCVR